MRNYIRERTISVASYILDNKTTIRKTAKKFGVSKSTVHNDLSKRLILINYEMYLKVKFILETNFNEKYLRGGEATRIKYLKK